MSSEDFDVHEIDCAVTSDVEYPNDNDLEENTFAIVALEPRLIPLGNDDQEDDKK